jgi:hypothetical protein
MPQARREQIETLGLPMKVLGAARYCRKEMPDNLWQDAILSLLAQLYEPLSEDPILKRIGERRPVLQAAFDIAWRAELGLEPTPLSEFEVEAIGLADIKETGEVFRIRGDRIAAPVIAKFVEDPAFIDLVGALVRALFPHGADTPPESLQASLAPLFSEENLPGIRAMAGIAIERAFQPHAIDDTREQLTLALDVLMETQEFGPGVVVLRSFLEALTDDALTPARVARTQDLALWVMETFLRPGGEQDALRMTASFIHSLMAPHHLKQTFGHVADRIQWLMYIPLLLASEIYVDADPDVITVREAAAYLGIKPRSVRTHIENCAGTENELPTWLEKKGRGKGTLAMRIEDLIAWEEKYWRPIRRERRT